MLTSARPRTLALVFGPTATEVAMLSPAGRELGPRARTEPNTSLWPLIEALGEFDRITAAGDDPHHAAADIARESQRPLRRLSLAELRWGRTLARRGVELALTVDGDAFASALFHDGREVPGLALGRHRFRKGLTYAEYLAPSIIEHKGVVSYARRLARAVGEILAVWNPTTLYLALPAGARWPEDPRIVARPLELALDAALTPWVSRAAESLATQPRSYTMPRG